MSDYTKGLLQKYVSGRISANEFVELQKYINLLPDEDLIFLLHQQWETQNPNIPFHKEDVERIIKHIHQETFPPKTLVMNRFKWFHTAVAAIFLLLIGFSLHLYLGKQEYIRLGERDFVMRTERGERVSMVLPDGTRVRLNAESVLSYRQNFGHSDRYVSFTGEGYFEVAKDTEKQFVVHTEHLDVKVLGTTFNLSVYEEDKMMELALISGSVEVSTNHEPFQSAKLHPNEKALFDTQTKQLTIARSFNQYETAWMENKLIFRSEPLKEVLRQISRKYGILIELEIPELEQDRYTGIFDEDINEVLNTLKVHYSFDYTIVKDTIHITKSTR